MQNLVKTLKSNNVPIDGIGMESHFIVGEVPTTLVENFQAFTALGVEIAITELDIRMTLPETAELLEQQKQDFYTVVDACVQVSGCRGITVWDWTDKVLLFHGPSVCVTEADCYGDSTHGSLRPSLVRVQLRPLTM